MNNKEEKAKVGRPKLADEELIKDSWCRIGASLAIVFVLVICGIGVLTTKTPLQVLTFQKSNSIQANVSKANTDSNVRVIPANTVKKVRVIPAKKVERRLMDIKGNVSRIILSNSSD